MYSYPAIPLKKNIFPLAYSKIAVIVDNVYLAFTDKHKRVISQTMFLKVLARHETTEYYSLMVAYTVFA